MSGESQRKTHHHRIEVVKQEVPMTLLCLTGWMSHTLARSNARTVEADSNFTQICFFCTSSVLARLRVTLSTTTAPRGSTSTPLPANKSVLGMTPERQIFVCVCVCLI